jgi:exoribonuclease-2
MIQADAREQTLDALTDFYFGENTPLLRAAMLRALMADPVRFVRTGLSFTPRSEAEMEEKRRALEARAARAALKEKTKAWLKEAVKKGLNGAGVPPDMEPVLDDLEAFLKAEKRSYASDVLTKLAKSQSGQELAFGLLLSAGRMDPASADWLLLAGIDPAFPEDVLQAAEALEPYAPDPSREDFSALAAFTIDDESTSDMDDALTVEPGAAGLRIGIHIADPSYFVAPGDALDVEALRRGLSVYLPSGSVPMFPEPLAHNLASLTAGALRPTLSFIVEFGADDELLSWRITRGHVRVARRLNYDEVDRILKGTDDPMAEDLRALDRVSEVLMDRRLNAGAMVILQPEYKVYVGDDIAIRRIETDTRARILIGEMMILANQLAARYALEHGLPVLFRAQDPPEDPELVGARIPYEPVRFRTLFRGVRPSRFTEYALPHAGLGLDAYVQITSPIRRYADLVLQRQIMAQLTGQDYPYQQSALLPILATADIAARASKGIEQQATKYWGFTYLDRKLKGKVLEAILVHATGGGYEAELIDTGIRGFLRTGEKLPLGTRCNVRIKRIEPRSGKLRLEPVRPGEAPGGEDASDAES